MRFKTWVTQITGLVGMVQKLKIRVVLPHGTNLRVFVLTYVILAPGACGKGGSEQEWMTPDSRHLGDSWDPRAALDEFQIVCFRHEKQ